jgi:phosphatidylserine/phosphatidylglycerophosphate/cardiolipin synthase-like enzyme
VADTKAHPAHDGRESDWLDVALSRAAGAAPVAGNRIRLLRDGPENFPAWLEAIASARRYVYFETYIFRGDRTGQQFVDALAARAREGVQVRVLYDWAGCFGDALPGLAGAARGGSRGAVLQSLRLVQPGRLGASRSPEDGERGRAGGIRLRAVRGRRLVR